MTEQLGRYQIIGKLTKAQKEAIVKCKQNKYGSYWMTGPAAQTTRALFNLGLADDPFNPSRLSPAGIRVRETLIKDKSDV